MSVRPGHNLPHYRTVEKIGADGMGEVRCVRDTRLDRNVTIKKSPESMACDEVFYRTGDTWYTSKVTLEPEFDFEPPRVVFQTDFIDTPGRSYDISADGQRMIVVKRAAPETRTRLHVISNWFDELKRLVPEND